MAERDGIGDTQAHNPESASPSACNGYKIGIRRVGNAVEITLTSASDYASMELYDSLIQSAKNGWLRLEINIPRP